MNKRRPYLTAISGLLIITLLVASFGSIKADNPGDLYSVGGWVTINGQPAIKNVNITLMIPNRTNCWNHTTDEGRYTIDFVAKQGERANFSVFISTKWEVHSIDNESFVITDASPHWYYINLSVNATEKQQEGGGGGDGGGGSSGGGGGNIPPVADLSAGEPYLGFVGEQVTFDGSKSHDSDGIITSWYWSFGDGTTATTATIAHHTYSTSGTFTVSLKVTDDQGAEDTTTTTATISYANQPPSVPTLSGPHNGTHNNSYDYTATSTDPENGTLTYTFAWGDGATDTSASTASGTPVTMSHTWNHAGVYTLSVTVFDVENASAHASMTVLMSVMWVDDLGYLIDYNGDGIYDAFYSNATGLTTPVQRLADGTYLIDADGNGVWDHQFNPLTNQLTLYTVLPMNGLGIDGTWVLAGILAGIVVLFLVVLLLTRRSKNKQETQDTPAPAPEEKPKGKSGKKK
jgi:PKD repeat protein